VKEDTLVKAKIDPEKDEDDAKHESEGEELTFE
jgi:hypothetical protein